MWTAPNILTLSRLAALPLVIWLFRSEHAIAAALLFVLVMLTDCVDGWLARRLRQTSNLGLYLDPVVDKIVLVALFYELAHARLLHPLIPHVFLARELLQNAIRAFGASRGRLIGANWMGKTKASLQTIAICWGLLTPACSHAVRPGLAHALGLGLHAFTWSVLVLSLVFLALFAHRNRTVLL